MASLFEQQLIPRQDFDAAEANLLVAEARHQEAIEEARSRQALLAQRVSELEIARQQLADTVLTAPFDGIIRERRAGPGDYVAVGAAGGRAGAGPSPPPAPRRARARVRRRARSASR